MPPTSWWKSTLQRSHAHTMHRSDIGNNVNSYLPGVRIMLHVWAWLAKSRTKVKFMSKYNHGGRHGNVGEASRYTVMYFQYSDDCIFIDNNVCTIVRNCFSAHERVIMVVISRVAKQRGNTHQNNTGLSTETVRHESAYIILFLTRHSKWRYKNDASFSFCWWRHNRLLMTSQWPDNGDAITWIVISNSLYVDYIHGNIHDRSVV